MKQRGTNPRCFVCIAGRWREQVAICGRWPVFVPSFRAGSYCSMVICLDFEGWRRNTVKRLAHGPGERGAGVGLLQEMCVVVAFEKIGAEVVHRVAAGENDFQPRFLV